MLHMQDGALLIILVYFIIVAIFLTILWRIATALDRISEHLFEISKDVKKLPGRSGKEAA
jgi:uncharacterized protein YoxC